MENCNTAVLPSSGILRIPSKNGDREEGGKESASLEKTSFFLLLSTGVHMQPRPTPKLRTIGRRAGPVGYDFRGDFRLFGRPVHLWF